MNQGSSAQFRRDNGVWQDGALLACGVSYTAAQSKQEGWTIVF